MYKEVSSMLLFVQSTVYDDDCHSYSLAVTSASLTFLYSEKCEHRFEGCSSSSSMLLN